MLHFSSQLNEVLQKPVNNHHYFLIYRVSLWLGHIFQSKDPEVKGNTFSLTSFFVSDWIKRKSHFCHSTMFFYRLKHSRSSWGGKGNPTRGYSFVNVQTIIIYIFHSKITDFSADTHQTSVTLLIWSTGSNYCSTIDPKTSFRT